MGDIAQNRPPMYDHGSSPDQLGVTRRIARGMEANNIQSNAVVVAGTVPADEHIKPALSDEGDSINNVDSDDEKHMLLGMKNKDPQLKSIYRNRIVSFVSLVLYMTTAIALGPLLSQYLHARYMEVYANNTRNSSDEVPCLASNISKEELQLHVKVQQETSTELLKISVCLSLPSIIVNMVTGSYSDYIGRKVLFLAPLMGGIFKFTILILVVKLHLPLFYILIASCIEGMTGSLSTFVMGSLAVAADTSTGEQSRTLALVITDTAMSAAMACGQLITGLLIQKIGFFYPLVLFDGFLILATFMITFGLSETVVKPKVKELSPLVHIKKVFGFYIKKGLHNKRSCFIFCLIVYILINSAIGGRLTVETLYQIGYPFCWSPVKVGYYGAFAIGVQAISGLMAVQLCPSCIKREILAVLGVLMAAASLMLEGLATSDAMLYAVPGVGALTTIPLPVLRSVMSRMADTDQQGALFSSLATVDTLSFAIGSIVFTSLYSGTLETLRGMVFLVIAGHLLIAAIFYIVVVIKVPSSRKYELMVTPPSVGQPEGSTVQSTQDSGYASVKSGTIQSI